MACCVMGKVGLVLPVADIADELTRHIPTSAVSVQDDVKEIVNFLKSSAPHDFTLYKPGTLERRIIRRMGLVGLTPGDTAGYLALLKASGEETYTYQI